MNYSKEIYNKAYAIVDDRRAAAISESERRKAKLYEEIPQLSEIDRKLTSASLATAKAVLSGGDTKAKLEELRNISLELQELRARLLSENGYRADYLEPEFTCPVCQDTTFVEKDGKSVYCQCFINLLRDCACDEINKLSPLKLSKFSTFRLDLYPFDKNAEGISAFNRMSKIFDYCREYAANFTVVDARSILMRGATGLGKTHLSLAIANELLERGHYVVYVSAPSILSKLEHAHFNFGNNEESSVMDTLCECDLLIIDDLGTEFVTNYSKSAIYNIFNNRLLRQKPTIINTNMTNRELESTYSQRFVSRIMGSCDKLDFIGRDIRAIKNM